MPMLSNRVLTIVAAVGVLIGALGAGMIALGGTVPEIVAIGFGAFNVYGSRRMQHYTERARSAGRNAPLP